MLRNKVRMANHLPGHILSKTQAVQKFLRWGTWECQDGIVPSTRSKNPILGIFHGPIQLPVLQESLRIERVWLRVYDFVVAYSPAHPTL